MSQIIQFTDPGLAGPGLSVLKSLLVMHGGDVQAVRRQAVDSMQQAAESAARMRGASDGSVRALSPLPPDAEKQLDDVAVRVGRKGLSLVSRLIDLGLTRPLPNWWEIPILRQEKTGDVGTAVRTMEPSGREFERGVVDRSYYDYPIYCTLDGANFHSRTIAVGNRVGVSIDTDRLERAVYNVNVANEEQALGTTTITFGGATAYGFINEPNVNPYTIPQAWATATGAQILAQIKACVALLNAANYYGPFELAVGTAYNDALNGDYASGYPKTIRERLFELTYGGRPLAITQVDRMPANTFVMFQADSNVVDVLIGQRVVPITWSVPPGWEIFSVVLDCIITRVKSDKLGNSGVVYATV